MTRKTHQLDSTETGSAPPKIAGVRPFSPRSFSPQIRQRFAADRRFKLVRHLGRAASYAECILIERVIRNEWDLRRLDAKLDAGEELSGHALRARLAMENRLRLDLRELGLKGVAERAPSFRDYWTRPRRPDEGKPP